MTVGQGVAEGYLSREELDAIAREGLAALPVDGRRVLVIIPDGTRTMPMPMMFELIERELGPRVAALDYLVALGTHSADERRAVERARGTTGRQRARRRRARSSITGGTTLRRSRVSGRFLRARSPISPEGACVKTCRSR